MRPSRINEDIVRDEIARLVGQWRRIEADPVRDALGDVLDDERIDKIDLFDRAQLAAVIETCRGSASLSEAGRKLFSVSRLEKSSGNDSDRLRKFLARFGLNFARIAGRETGE